MRLKFSLTALLAKLLDGAPSAPQEVLDDGKKVGTTVRFDTRTRVYIEQQAEHLGISTQEFVSMTFRALMIAGDDKSGIRGELELMGDRFLQVFAKHGIPAADIPELVSDQISRSDLASTTLIDKLDGKILDQVSDIFSVSVNWLKAASNYVVDGPHLTLYKNLYGAATHLIKLINIHRRVSVIFVAHDSITPSDLCRAKEKGDSATRVEVGVVIQKHNHFNELSFVSYEVWDSERWNYWRCRYYLKSLMLFAENAGISYKGVLVPREAFESIFQGKRLAVEVLSNYRNVWYPDQLLWEDEQNPERDEISLIKDFYAQEKVSELEKVARKPYLIKNRKEFLEGKKMLEIKEDI